MIAPDNAEKKFGELRNYLFGDLKTKDECFNEELEYDEKTYKLEEGMINVEILEIIVKNTFRKAIREKEYCIFYGELCEKMMKMELCLMNQEVKVSNMKNSIFRKQLLQACKETFENFFDIELRAKETENDEKTANFIEKLFGNMEFVGELYRRKILPIQTLLIIFQSLLGISETNTTIDDLVVEAAINLMNKVGQKFEEQSKSTSSKKGSQNQDSFDAIMKEFKVIEEKPDGEGPITNRIKILIKNMFTNSEAGWEKTKKINEAGPRTKAEVEKEVRDKYEKEAARHSDSRNDRGDRRDGGYNNRDNNRDHRDNRNQGGRDQRGGGDQRYQKKDTN